MTNSTAVTIIIVQFLLILGVVFTTGMSTHKTEMRELSEMRHSIAASDSLTRAQLKALLRVHDYAIPDSQLVLLL